jgi:hypothetical protein
VEATLTLEPDLGERTVLGDQLARTTNGAPITIAMRRAASPTASLLVTGQADFLNSRVRRSPSWRGHGSDTASGCWRGFTADRVRGGPPWKFSRSFPNLPPFASGIRSPSRQGPARLPTRSIPSSCPTRLRHQHADHATDSVTERRSAGLELRRRIVPTGLLGLFETILSGGQRLVLHGRIVIPKATEATLPPPSRYLVRFSLAAAEPAAGHHCCARTCRSNPSSDRRCAAQRLHCASTAHQQDLGGRQSELLALSRGVDRSRYPERTITVQLTRSACRRPALVAIGVFEGVTLGRLEHLVDLAGGKRLASSCPMTCARRRACWKASAARISLDLGAGWQLESRRVTSARQSEHQGAARLHGRQPDGQLHGLRAVRAAAARSRSMVGGHSSSPARRSTSRSNCPSVAPTARTTDTSACRSARWCGIRAGAPDMPDLPINELQMEIAATARSASSIGSPRHRLDARSRADQPDRRRNHGRGHAPAGEMASGQVSGAIAFGNVFTLAVTYLTPGSFTMKAVLPRCTCCN